MELNWSLKEIYSSFESQEFKNDLNDIDKLIKDINLWAIDIVKDKENLVEKLEEYISQFTLFKNLSSKLESFVNLSLSVNTKNKDALKYSDILEKKLTNIVGSSVKLERYISEIDDIDVVINQSKILKEHKFILKNIIEQSRYLLSEKEEAIIANMRNTGSSAWGKLKDNLISNLKVKFEENGEVKEIPLTMVLNMANDKDEKVRKRAYEAEINSYKKVEEGVAAALNAIKGEVITVCDFRGYESPLDKTLKDSRLDKESLEAMLSAMKESIPTFRKYLRRKGEILGHKNGLPFYDLYAPVCGADMKFSYEEGTKFVEKNFRTFSEHLGDFAKKAINNNWIDVKPNEGKVGGAFCENLHFIGESRILLNYGDNFGDVVTLAHELGHGFHGECLNYETTLNSDYPMPIAETASTFCETIIKKAAIKDATKEEALAILETEISDCTQVIVDIYSRFLFEKSFFEARKESSLSVEKIKELMIRAQREAYGDGLDPDFLHPYMWTWKPHYYDAEYNYYNFPYAFGLLFAKGLYAEYLKKGQEFAKDYEQLLAITGKNKLTDVAKFIGIDISDKEFWKNSLKIIEEDINKFIELSEQ
jgi:pepF/M3 family oligoendopeptidase